MFLWRFLPECEDYNSQKSDYPLIDLLAIIIVPFILPLPFNAQHPKHIIADLCSIHHFPYYFNK